MVMEDASGGKVRKRFRELDSFEVEYSTCRSFLDPRLRSTVDAKTLPRTRHSYSSTATKMELGLLIFFGDLRVHQVEQRLWSKSETASIPLLGSSSRRRRNLI